jgi:hypothetical protein
MLREVFFGLLVVGGLSTAQATEPTLTLACEGTMSSTVYFLGVSKGENRSSLGIIVNLADRTVKGFGKDTDEVKVDSVNETVITFLGETVLPGTSDYWTLSGKIDRVTGNLRATEKVGRIGTYVYSLTCKPTQRMF